MNPVLILTHNCLELTKRCVESVLKQDVDTTAFIVDNDSTDGTWEWARGIDGVLRYASFSPQIGVSAGWNSFLRYWFKHEDIPHVLVLNNDTEIPPYFYRKLLSYDLPFVTGISVDEPDDHPEAWHQPAEHPDFSAFLIRRDAWEKVGPFDERMVMYAQDCDWHVRAHRAGIRLLNAGVPFHHERSSTLRLANSEDKEKINKQADADRRVFKEKYGCFPWEPAYGELFK